MLWNTNIDHMVKVLPDGNECMQCIELDDNTAKPYSDLISLSPNARIQGQNKRCQECIDQMYEIVLKYQPTHEIVIGGDLNVDLAKTVTGDSRLEYINS